MVMSGIARCAKCGGDFTEMYVGDYSFQCEDCEKEQDETS